MTHVAVLMGGWSAEREVSLASGNACAEALESKGYTVTKVDVDRDLAIRLREVTPDVAFNALHGRFGEDGTVQGLLEIIGLPYTHSGVLASSMAMDKPVARQLYQAHGLPVAEGRVLSRQDMIAGKGFDAPYVLKPLNEGSSVGVELVFEQDNFDPTDAAHWRFGDRVLTERYIPGREIQVAVLDDRALGAIEIVSPGRFYDYDAKYAPGGSKHLMPAPLSDADYQEACRLGLAAHQVLGCRGVTRTDLRFDDTGDGPGKFIVLETNTQPGMTATSLAPEIAQHQGISFADLCALLVEDASCDR